MWNMAHWYTSDLPIENCVFFSTFMLIYRRVHWDTIRPINTLILRMTVIFQLPTYGKVYVSWEEGVLFDDLHYFMRIVMGGIESGETMWNQQFKDGICKFGQLLTNLVVTRYNVFFRKYPNVESWRVYPLDLPMNNGQHGQALVEV